MLGIPITFNYKKPLKVLKDKVEHRELIKKKNMLGENWYSLNRFYKMILI